MPIARPNVKRKRYQIRLKICSFSLQSRQIVLRNAALFPLHFRQNWLNTLRPPFDLRSAGRVGPKPGDPSPERERDQRRAGRWDQVTAGSSMPLGAIARDQGLLTVAKFIYLLYTILIFFDP